MAKYIRTKYGVYEILAETGTLYYTDFTGAEGVIKSDKIKQADNIQDLCDMFVLADDEFKHVDLVSDYNDVRQMLSYDLFGQSCYGAIWTKDGLKFVAKRNCFGELELI